MISVMALLDRNYVRQTAVSTGNAVVEKSIPSAPFLRLYLPHIFPQTSSNVRKKFWFRLFLWNKFMTCNSMHIKTNISKHFTQEQISLPTSGREIPCCHLQQTLKGSMSDICSDCLVQTGAIQIVSAHQSTYKAEILTQSIINSIWCQNLMAITKRLLHSLAKLWIVIHLHSSQIP